ncbi:MAG: CocE/NonD family hydrolase [Candidatus Thermoplasmatota archaeon]|nr:CocE/NonD family hydrolase [Candidatus Thermoplasmatota archaeon]
MSDVFEAELLDDTQETAGRRDLMQLNIAMAATAVVVILFMILASIWGSGMFSSDSKNGVDDYDWWDVPLELRHEMDLDFTGSRSQLPENGTYSWTGPSEYFVEVDLPPSEQDAGYPEPALMHVALWLPDVPPGMQVPVIATVHPYYDFGGEGLPGVGDDSSPNTVPDGGVGAWVLDQFVPHGYALAQISTFGSGKSTHCQDVKGLGEQVGIQAAVQWLGEQNWSNGNVGLMGKSYAGTTNWEAAQNPSEHLKTIVPISGSIGVQQMFYRNGSSEARAVGYDMAYEGATADMTTDDMRICSDDIVGPAMPVTTSLAAEAFGAEWSDYWEERYHLGDVLENYKGSVYLVWGLQDWNVDPYHAFPAYQMLLDAGINARAIAGQWAHNYPDQPDRHSSLDSGYGAEAFPNMSRMDWAIELYVWFEYYLKGIGEEPSPQVQIQTHDGRWHVEETWPPEDITWNLTSLDMAIGEGTWVSASSSATILMDELTEDIHISGLPTLHLAVSARTCNGGQIFATMYSDLTGVRLGHATMDLRYRDGGYDAKPVIPLQSYTMLMEFNPLDVRLEAGDSIRIELTESGEDYLPSTCASLGLSVYIDDRSTLGLPIIERPQNDDRWFDVPPWWNEPENVAGF